MNPAKARRTPIARPDPYGSKYTWLYTSGGGTLHFVPAADDRPGEATSGMEFWDRAVEEGGAEAVAACGRTMRLFAPGILSRMYRPRCRRCCAALGVPPGLGAPFNESGDEDEHLKRP